MEQKISTLEKKIAIEDLFSGNVEEQKASPEFGIPPYGWKTYMEYDTSDGKTAIRYKDNRADGRMELAIVNKNHSPRPRIVHMVFVGNKVGHADYGVVKWGKKKPIRKKVFEDDFSNLKGFYDATEAIKLALARRGKNYYPLVEGVYHLG